MGFRRCETCGRTISDRAPGCPFCARSEGPGTGGAIAASAGVLAAPVTSAPLATPDPAVVADPKVWEPTRLDGLAWPTRLAGWMLMLGGVLVALAPTESFYRTGAFVDIVLGAALALDKEKVRNWALVRVVIGLIVWPILALVQHDPVSLAIQVLYSVSLLVLLRERPRRALVPWAIGVGGLVLLLTGLGLVVMQLAPPQARQS
jgi:hypothetical protein